MHVGPLAPPYQLESDRMTAAVPVISMSLPADEFAKDFGASFERFGFAMITDHGIDPGLIDEAWAKAKAFFALPEELKRAYRSEEHTSELQSLMRISYAVFGLKK